ncbi:MAG TPA: hypothetical protein PK778_07240 [Bacillota bacterium]|nr:hypothetical protein [Bacillota bacterium]
MDMFRNNTTDFASMYKKFEKIALKDVEKINEAFSEVLGKNG